MSRISRALRALPRHLPEATLAVLFALLFLAWSWLTLTGCTSILDAHARPPILRPRSYPGQIAEALSLVTHPFLIVIAIVSVAVFSFRRRMRRLSLALAVAHVDSLSSLSLSPHASSTALALFAIPRPFP